MKARLVKLVEFGVMDSSRDAAQDSERIGLVDGHNVDSGRGIGFIPVAVLQRVHCGLADATYAESIVPPRVYRLSSPQCSASDVELWHRCNDLDYSDRL